MSDKVNPATPDARKFANAIAREISRKIEMDRASEKWLVDFIDERFSAALEQKDGRIKTLEGELADTVSSRDIETSTCLRYYKDLFKQWETFKERLPQSEQANKELLEALRKAQCPISCGNRTTVANGAQFPICAKCAALSKHGGKQ